MPRDLKEPDGWSVSSLRWTLLWWEGEAVRRLCCAWQCGEGV